MQEFKDLTEEQKTALVEQLNATEEQDTLPPGMQVTEVTSIAEEEERTGQKIVLPDAELLVNKAVASIIRERRIIEELLLKLSKRGMIRAMMAVLDLPVNRVPVGLQQPEEKLLYIAGQKLLTARHLVVHHHTTKALNEYKLKQQEKELENAKQEIHQG